MHSPLLGAASRSHLSSSPKHASPAPAGRGEGWKVRAHLGKGQAVVDLDEVCRDLRTRTGVWRLMQLFTELLLIVAAAVLVIPRDGPQLRQHLFNILLKPLEEDDHGHLVGKVDSRADAATLVARMAGGLLARFDGDGDAPDPVLYLPEDLWVMALEVAFDSDQEFTLAVGAEGWCDGLEAFRGAALRCPAPGNLTLVREQVALAYGVVPLDAPAELGSSLLHIPVYSALQTASVNASRRRLANATAALARLAQPSNVTVRPQRLAVLVYAMHPPSHTLLHAYFKAQSDGDRHVYSQLQAQSWSVHMDMAVSGRSAYVRKAVAGALLVAAALLRFLAMYAQWRARRRFVAFRRDAGDAADGEVGAAPILLPDLQQRGHCRWFLCSRETYLNAAFAGMQVLHAAVLFSCSTTLVDFPPRSAAGAGSESGNIHDAHIAWLDWALPWLNWGWAHLFSGGVALQLASASPLLSSVSMQLAVPLLLRAFMFHHGAGALSLTVYRQRGTLFDILAAALTLVLFMTLSWWMLLGHYSTGYEDFQTFARSFYTILTGSIGYNDPMRVMTLDRGWWYTDYGIPQSMGWLKGVFLVTLVIIVFVLVFNVVLAAMLEGFRSPPADGRTLAATLGSHAWHTLPRCGPPARSASGRAPLRDRVRWMDGADALCLFEALVHPVRQRAELPAGALAEACAARAEGCGARLLLTEPELQRVARAALLADGALPQLAGPRAAASAGACFRLWGCAPLEQRRPRVSAEVPGAAGLSDADVARIAAALAAELRAAAPSPPAASPSPRPGVQGQHPLQPAAQPALLPRPPPAAVLPPAKAAPPPRPPVFLSPERHDEPLYTPPRIRPPPQGGAPPAAWPLRNPPPGAGRAQPVYPT
eukprot:TRINITY_DN36461_c0_g1_i1.p1 TRINITY_DN36461_c0_g1~~TRINITY_DN36461_c0_g1_i1.p1  ORF type:complete len:897 (+),score=230.80 TRINITY_DN36461_c0_g1_i1:66-2693(+)